MLWIGYFVLEGFDFGVGMLLPVLGRDDTDRRVMINTIGPVWDGNEVWLLVAGGATFAAFPDWYATLFSGFYLPLLLILLALIVRGVAFEYRGKLDDAAWRRRWDLAIFWRLAGARAAVGRRLRQHRARRADRRATTSSPATCSTLLNPYALLGGLTTLPLFTLHGAVFLALKTDGDVRDRARALAGRLALVAVARGRRRSWCWTQVATRRRRLAWSLVAVAALALVAAWRATAARPGGLGVHRQRRSTIALAVVALFGALFPTCCPRRLDPAFSLTIDERVVGRPTR